MKMFDADENNDWAATVTKKTMDDMLSRFHLISVNVTDRQTDGQICYVIIARQYDDAR